MSSFAVAPGQARTLRACMVCSIVQPQSVSILLLPYMHFSFLFLHTDSLFFSEIQPRRLPQLRTRPQPPRQQRSNPGMHLAGLRGPNLHHRRAPELGGALAASGGLCAGDICDQGGRHAAGRDDCGSRRRWREIYPVSIIFTTGAMIDEMDN